MKIIIILALALMSPFALGLAANSSFSCELSSQIKSYMFDYDAITLTAPHIGWFVLVKNYKVILQNTEKNITYEYNVTEVMKNTSTEFYATSAIYLKNVDILVIGGNGAYAVINATSPVSNRSNYILEATNPGTQLVFGLQQFSNESFVIGYVDYAHKGDTGSLYSYNTTNWSSSMKPLNFYPQTFVALSSEELIYSYYGGYNEQRLSLPNLTVIQNISMSAAIQPNIYGLVPNNHTSYFYVTIEDGINFFMYNDSRSSFNFGKEQNITEINALNHNNAFAVYENYTSITSYSFNQGPGGFIFTQIGSTSVRGIQGDSPYQLAIASGKYDQFTNTYQSQVVAGFFDYYRVYDCTFVTNPVQISQLQLN